MAAQKSIKSNEDRLKILYESELLIRQNLYESSSKPIPDDWRKWWGSVERMLIEFIRQSKLGTPVSPLKAHPLPISIVETLAGLAGYLAVGTIPLPISGVQSKGNSSIGPSERQHISLAIAYKLAASPDGLVYDGGTLRVNDPTSTKTICEWFGVRSSTVTKWVREIEPRDLGSSEVPQKFFIKAVEKAGKIYREAGRSHIAIATRNVKALPLRR
jgi:hypothetical protein